MRQAIIEVIGSLITDLANAESEQADAKQTQKQIGGLFNLLLERVLDNSSYVRSKVFAVLAKLMNIKAFKFPKHRLHITDAAVAALDDKNSSVRKAAAILLVQMLLTHPYALTHGGMLHKETWETEYKEVAAALEKIEGQMGNVVNTGGDEEAEQVDGEEGESKKKKKLKKFVIFDYNPLSVHSHFGCRSKKANADESMDVDEEDEEDEEEDEADGDGDTEEDEPSKMSIDDEEDDEGATPKKAKGKKNKLQPRKSQLDVNALTQEQAALAQYDQRELTERRLRKKYYRDALTFIDQIESAMDPMCKLLGSKNKAEVLEVMEFFKVAHEYQFESAKVSSVFTFVS